MRVPKSGMTATGSTHLTKRSIVLAGHATSLALEAPFWAALERWADAVGRSVPDLVAEIDAARTQGSLASAVRVELLRQAHTPTHLTGKREDNTTMPTPIDRAYANKPYIPNAEGFSAHWADLAASFRASQNATLDLPYGVSRREHLDLFWPEGEPQGLAMFIHGGYWMAFDKNSWSHLSKGPLAHGFAVAVPSYPLCPSVRLSDIVGAVAAALAVAAERVAGPIHLTGHSAGGHLAARLACVDTQLPEGVAERITRVVPISGLHDLRPLRQTAMNETLQLDNDEARRESPVLCDPLDVDLIAWVGDGERPQLRRQTRLLAMIWEGLARSVQYVEAPDRHHFDVIEDLENPDSALTRAFVGDLPAR